MLGPIMGVYASLVSVMTKNTTVHYAWCEHQAINLVITIWCSSSVFSEVLVLPHLGLPESFEESPYAYNFGKISKIISNILL